MTTAEAGGREGVNTARLPLASIKTSHRAVHDNLVDVSADMAAQFEQMQFVKAVVATRVSSTLPSIAGFIPAVP